MRKFFKNFLALSFGIIVSLFLLEIFLRIYNPFPTRIKGDKIILPINKKYVFDNIRISGLDTYIVHSKNALGFRGEEFPKNADNRTKIFAVGGSTTECLFLSDGKDWPNVLAEKLKAKDPAIWLNNAGLDGHSTFGHTILLQDYLVKFKPDYILFLIGTNDVERADLDKFDSMHIRNYTTHRNWKGKLVEHTELAALAHNFYMTFKAHQHHLTHFNFNLSTADTLTLKQEEAKKALDMQNRFLPLYKNRLQNIINICKEKNIKPVFITQPYLLGFGIDSLTGVNLAKVEIWKRDGETQWKILQLYNTVTKQIAKENNILHIDLAEKMPKQSVYFYDVVHFTNAGGKKVADIVAEELIPYISSQKNAL